MLGYGLMGGVFGGGDSLARVNANPFTNNMVKGGSGISSANTGQNNATASDANVPATGANPFSDLSDLGFTGGPNDSLGNWRQQSQSLARRRGVKTKTTTPKPPPPTGVGPLASTMQASPMQAYNFNNPFTYF